jgi:hypothetical protein
MPAAGVSEMAEKGRFVVEWAVVRFPLAIDGGFVLSEVV